MPKDTLKPPKSRKKKESSSESDSEGNTTRKRPKNTSLTEQEKRSNHIESEKKRRANIKEGFDQVTSRIPDLDSSASEANILQHTYHRVSNLLAEKQKLQNTIETYAKALKKSPTEMQNLLQLQEFDPN